MERLSPHIIMRRGMVDTVVYPAFVDHLVEYTAKSLYFTSDLAMPAAEKKPLMALFAANTALCKITEDLIFTDPYRIAELNRWTSPELDDVAAAIRGDAELKRAVSVLKYKFLCHGEALLHGDLHTGSIMVTATDTRVIDPEFAFFGPMGFDVGKLIGNLLLELFQPGRARAGARRARCLPAVDARRRSSASGTASSGASSSSGAKIAPATPIRPISSRRPSGDNGGDPACARSARRSTPSCASLFEDALGYAGTSMIRRILGLAHNIDLELIEDQGRGPPARSGRCRSPSI
jgi:5-methylthioribose kinase